MAVPLKQSRAGGGACADKLKEDIIEEIMRKLAVIRATEGCTSAEVNEQQRQRRMACLGNQRQVLHAVETQALLSATSAGRSTSAAGSDRVGGATSSDEPWQQSPEVSPSSFGGLGEIDIDEPSAELRYTNLAETSTYEAV